MSEVLGRTIRVTNQPELTAIGCAQLAGAGLDEVLVTEKKGRAYSPKGNLRPDWMEKFSSLVKRISRPS